MQKFKTTIEKRLVKKANFAHTQFEAGTITKKELGGRLKDVHKEYSIDRSRLKSIENLKKRLLEGE